MTPPRHPLQKLRFAFLALIAAIPGLQAQTVSVTTGSVGYSKATVHAGGGVVAPVFVKQAVYTSVATVSGQTFTASNLTANSYGPTTYNDRPNAPRYYVEITSGSYSGYAYDVQANASNSITVYGLPGALNGQTNVSIALRPHTTLGDLAAASSGLSDYSDFLTLYQSNNAKSSYVYTSSGVVGDDYYTPCDQVVIYPGTGVLLNNSYNASFTFGGAVKTNPTVVPVYAGETLLAPLDPQGGKRITALNLAGLLDAYSDAVALYSTSGDLGITAFYSDGSDLLDESYASVNPASAPVVAVGNGFIINTGSDRTWTNLTSF